MKFKFLFIAQLLSVIGWAQQIPTYYSSIDFSQNGNALKYQLSDLIQSTHDEELSYTPGVWNTLKMADVDPNQSDKVLLLYGWNDQDDNIYNDRSRDKYATCHTSDCNNKWVREHVFPRSKGNPNLGFEGPGSDAHHLRAIDYERNSLRSNFKFSNNTPLSDSYSKVITQGTQSFFFPGDEWKGDVARMIMYMYVRYETQCLPVNVAAGSTSYSPLGDMPNILLQWNAEDPVSTFEINRNEIIYSVQGNRNPFIDNPFLANKIWGGPLATNTWSNLSDNLFDTLEINFYPNPTNDQFHISGLEEISSYEIHLYDINGRKLNSFYNQNTISILDYSSGIYWVELQSENSSLHKKVVKK